MSRSSSFTNINTWTRKEDTEGRARSSSVKKDASFSLKKTVKDVKNLVRKTDEGESTETLPTSLGFVRVKGQLKDASLSKLALVQELNVSHRPILARETEALSANSSDASTESIMAPLQNDGPNPAWIVRFSPDGMYLAVGLHNGDIQIWCLESHTEESGSSTIPVDSTKVKTSLMHRIRSLDALKLKHEPNTSTDSISSLNAAPAPSFDASPLFQSEPVRVYKTHSLAITDLAWSSAGFLLSSSLDGLVMLWHLKHFENLVAFQHTDAVSSVAFHPTDESVFASGSIDGKLRTWSIPDKKMISWNEIFKTPITALSYVSNGLGLIAGTASGTCVFYETENLRYNTQISVSSTQSSHKSKDLKITGIESFPIGRGTDDEKFLVSSSDSRVRMFNLRDKSVVRKYRGMDLKQSRIHASLSMDGEYLLCGSEDKLVYVFNTTPGETQPFSSMLSTVKTWQGGDQGRVTSYERFIASDAHITCAVLAPLSTSSLVAQFRSRSNEVHTLSDCIIAVSDITGRIRIFQNNPVLRKSLGPEWTAGRVSDVSSENHELEPESGRISSTSSTPKLAPSPKLTRVRNWTHE